MRVRQRLRIAPPCEIRLVRLDRHSGSVVTAVPYAETFVHDVADVGAVESHRDNRIGPFGERQLASATVATPEAGTALMRGSAFRGRVLEIMHVRAVPAGSSLASRRS